MNDSVKNSFRFIGFVLIQSIVFNQMEVGYGIQIMVYPLYILLLNVEINILTLLLVSFVFGLSIDGLSNTFGLHASSALVVAYLRPTFLKLFAPRDNYDPNKSMNFFTLGFKWYLKTFGTLIVIHHLWFFSLEIFRMDGFLMVLQKTVLSAPISFGMSILLHYVFLISDRNES